MFLSSFIVFKLTTFLHREGTIQTQYIPKYEKVVQYVDRNGNSYAQLEQLELDKQNMKAVIDSLNVKIKAKGQVTDISSYTQKTDTVFVKIPVKRDRDTISFLKKDGYVYVLAKADLVNNTGEITLQSIDTITTVTKTKNRLFSAPVNTITLINKNPYNHITSGYSVVLKEKRTIIDISAQVGYNPLSQRPYVGIGIGFPIIQIKSRR